MGSEPIDALRDAIAGYAPLTDGTTAGIPLIGIPPESRRKGIAREIMVGLPDEVRARGLRYATLRASAMSEGLYRELGFEAQGRVRSFRVPSLVEP